MCTRYYIEKSPELRPFVDTAKASYLGTQMVAKLGKPLSMEGEIRPADMVPVIASNKKGFRSVFPMVWGYNVPGLERPLINARIETAGVKEIWMEGWKSHRCAVPASWYYEWKYLQMGEKKVKTKEKYMIQERGKAKLFLAGIYRMEVFRGLSSPVFSIITQETPKELRWLNDRMPLILPEDRIDEWIKPETKAEDMLQYSQTDLIVEKAC